MTVSRLIALEENDGVLIARILGTVLLDSRLVQGFTRELLSMVAEHKASKVIVDFSLVTRCSTEVINSLLMTKKQLLADGGDLRICKMSESIRHTYRILNLDGTVFDIFDTEEEAVDGFGSN